MRKGSPEYVRLLTMPLDLRHFRWTEDVLKQMGACEEGLKEFRRRVRAAGYSPEEGVTLYDHDGNTWKRVFHKFSVSSLGWLYLQLDRDAIRSEYLDSPNRSNYFLGRARAAFAGSRLLSYSNHRGATELLVKALEYLAAHQEEDKA